MRLVDDSYNANRQSAIAAVNLLKGATIANGARRWFVFGDMLELGTFSRDEHAVVGVAAAGAVDELVLVGMDVQATAEAAIRAGMQPARVHLFSASLQNPTELAQARSAAAALVCAAGKAGDLVLVKGSLGIGMDAIVTELQERRVAGHTSPEITSQPGPLA